MTHAFSCSTCFDDLILGKLAQTLGSRELCPDFQVLVSIRELPSQPYLQKIGELALCCSWNAACPARVYVPTHKTGANLTSLLNPGDEVLIPAPVYAAHF